MSPGPNGWEDVPEEEREALEAWRGELHPDQSEEEWPEDLAGPEYWLLKGLEQDEEREQ